MDQYKIWIINEKINIETYSEENSTQKAVTKMDAMHIQLDYGSRKKMNFCKKMEKITACLKVDFQILII